MKKVKKKSVLTLGVSGIVFETLAPTGGRVSPWYDPMDACGGRSMSEVANKWAKRTENCNNYDDKFVITQRRRSSPILDM